MEFCTVAVAKPADVSNLAPISTVQRWPFSFSLFLFIQHLSSPLINKSKFSSNGAQALELKMFFLPKS